MFASVGLTISALFFTLVIAVVYLSKRKYPNIQNSLYKFLLLLTILLLVLELYCVYFMKERAIFPLLNEVLCRGYILGAVVWFVGITIYVWSLGREDINIKNLFKNPFVIFMILFGIISFMISCFLPISYTSGKNNELFVIGGQCVYCLYVIFAFLGSFIIYVLFKNKYKASFFERLPIFFFLIFYFVMIIFQYLYADINDLTFMFGLTMVAMYFTVVSQDSKLVADLEVANVIAEKSNKDKTEFLSKMSHEIRTPLNAIMGFSESILNDKELTEEKINESSRNIFIAGNNLISIINNILDVSKLESGKEVLEYKEYSIRDVVLELIDYTETRLDKSKVTFEVEVSSNIPKTLYGDKNKIMKVLENILSNSAKFTKVGKIKLSITGTKIEDKEDILFEISDTGPGIKSEDIPKVFTKFTKIDSASETMESGAGLGLNISKQLVEMMEGRISFISEYGIGTTFKINLQNKIIDYTNVGNVLEEKEVHKKNEKLDCSSKKILVVDDNDINLKIAKRLLSDYKAEIECVPNGLKAIELLKKSVKFDLILLDRMMPDLNGAETLKLMKKIPDYELPPVVMVTANSDKEFDGDYQKEGFDDYLAKPIDSKKLDELINKYFRK